MFRSWSGRWADGKTGARVTPENRIGHYEEYHAMPATLLVTLSYEVEVQRYDLAKRRISTSTDNGLVLTGLASFILVRTLIKIIL